jgi:DNA-binding XRE family transcriptional regulator
MDMVDPVGTRIQDHISEMAAGDPDFRAELTRTEPYHQAAMLIVRIRMERGLTQEALARRIGTTKSAISRLESGRHKPNIDTLERIARAFGKRLTIMFEDVDQSAGHVAASRLPRAALP